MLHFGQESRGIPHLIDRMVATLRMLLVPVELHIPYDRSDLVAQCYEYGRVHKADYQTEYIHVEADITRDLAGRVGRSEMNSPD